MSAGIRALRVALMLAGFGFLLQGVHAQDNATAAPSIGAAEPTDSDRFFQRYAEAKRLVQQNRVQDASVVMDLLWKNLSSSPWLEIALLKHAELNETFNDQVALEGYQLLSKRLDNAPYFQGSAEKARVFRASLQGAVERGIDRVRIGRVREALGRYYGRHTQYPESLMKLSILGYTDMENIYSTGGRSFRYTPMGQQLTPFISYHRYELESVAPEPFYVTSPRIDGTTLVGDEPRKYAALVRVPRRIDAQRVVEDQTLEGFFVAAVAPYGAILCAPERVLILPVSE